MNMIASEVMTPYQKVKLNYSLMTVGNYFPSVYQVWAVSSFTLKDLNKTISMKKKHYAVMTPYKGEVKCSRLRDDQHEGKWYFANEPNPTIAPEDMWSVIVPNLVMIKKSSVAYTITIKQYK